jgi:hypothetical protein
MFTMWNLASHNPNNFITTSPILYKSLKLQTEKRKKKYFKFKLNFGTGQFEKMRKGFHAIEE